MKIVKSSTIFKKFFIGRKIKRRKKNLIGGKMKSVEIHFFGFIRLRTRMDIIITIK